MKLKCRIGYHDWTEWDKPHKSDKKLWDVHMIVQERTCNECNLTEIRDI